MGFGTYAVDTNAKSGVNRLFVFMMSSTATWAFAYSILASVPTAEASVFWGCMSVFGWGIFYSIMLHFVLILTKIEIRLNKWVLHTLIYLPAVINILLYAPFGYLAEKQYHMVDSDFGWINVLPIDMGKLWFVIYYSVFSIVTLVILIRWWRNLEPQDPQKRLARNFLISALFPLIFGVVTETIPDIFGIEGSFPELTVVFLMVPVTMLSSTLRRSGLLLERPVEVSLPLKSDQPAGADRLRMFRTVASVFTAGSAVSFFIGYFAMKRSTREEFFLAAILLLLGIFIRYIPRITKNHSNQNILFLFAGIYSLFYLMMRNVETGAVTIWSIYILFFMFTVILDSKIYLTIYAGLVVLIQVIFSVFYPAVTVTIDLNTYITRVALVILTYVAVRRLADEYTLKLDARQHK